MHDDARKYIRENTAAVVFDLARSLAQLDGEALVRVLESFEYATELRQQASERVGAYL